MANKPVKMSAKTKALEKMEAPAEDHMQRVAVVIFATPRGEVWDGETLWKYDEEDSYMVFVAADDLPWADDGAVVSWISTYTTEYNNVRLRNREPHEEL